MSHCCWGRKRERDVVLATERRQRASVMCAYTPTGSGCLQTLPWSLRPGTFQTTLILAHPLSILLCTWICRWESSSARQIETRQGGYTQGHAQVAYTGLSQSRNPHKTLWNLALLLLLPLAALHRSLQMLMLFIPASCLLDWPAPFVKHQANCWQFVLNFWKSLFCFRDLSFTKSENILNTPLW